MGVPVITLVSDRVVGRAGLSQLSNLHLEELVAWSKEDFIRLADELAADVARVAVLRRELRQRMLASPLADGGRFAKVIESAYRQMWRDWCQAAPRARYSL